MHFNVLDENLVKIATVDNYISLMWCKRYNEVGGLDLEVEASEENISLYKPLRFIQRDDDDDIFRIEALELKADDRADNSLIIGGFDLKHIVRQRVNWKVFTGGQNMTAEDYIRQLVMDNITNPINTYRRINNFDLGARKGFEEKLQMQTDFDNLQEKITEICIMFGYGWKVIYRDGRFKFELYKGIDRSANQNVNPRVVFSSLNDNLSNIKYKVDYKDFKNCARVGGEGEADVRRFYTSGDDFQGLDRYEMFVDASSITSATTPTWAQYDSLLDSEGEAKLAETHSTTEFEAEVDTYNTYEYKKDYSLGDIVTIRTSYGVRVDARITEVIETFDEEGYTVEPKFEYIDAEKTLAQTTEALYTETGEPLITEKDTDYIEVEGWI